MNALDEIFGVGSGTGLSTGSLQRPGSLGWTIFAPRCEATEFNIVSLCKAHGRVTNTAEIDKGWDLCRRLNVLKKAFSHSSRTVASTDTLVEYLTLICAVREHVATNENDFRYENMTPTSELDFEAYMIHAILAARDVDNAIEARRIQSQEAYVTAAEFYERASWLLEEAFNLLCKSMPPEDRLRHRMPLRDWSYSLVAAAVEAAKTLTRPVANTILLARVYILRAEASACRRHALSLMMAEDSTLIDDELLEGTAAFVASRFAMIVRKLSDIGLSQSSMGNYAGAASLFWRLQVITSMARRDLQAARDTLNVDALARVFRLLDSQSLPRLSTGARKAIGDDLLQQIDALMSTFNDLRDAANRLHTEDISGAFHLLDLTGTASAPTYAQETDPNLVGENSRIEEIRDLKVVSLAKNENLLTFLRPRTVGDPLPLVALPLSREEARGTEGAADNRRDVVNDFDLGFRAIFKQLTDFSSDEKRAAIMRDKAILGETLRLAFELGRLSERSAWLRFALYNDDGSDPDSVAIKDSREIEVLRRDVFQYLGTMAGALDLEFKNQGQ